MGFARCDHCHAEFQAKTVRRRFCNEKCRKAAWQATRDRDLALALEALDQAALRLRKRQRAKGTA